MHDEIDVVRGRLAVEDALARRPAPPRAALLDHEALGGFQLAEKLHARKRLDKCGQTWRISHRVAPSPGNGSMRATEYSRAKQRDWTVTEKLRHIGNCIRYCDWNATRR